MGGRMVKRRQNEFKRVVDGVYQCSDLSPELLEFAFEVYKRTLAYVAPGDWLKASVGFEDFATVVPELCEIMRVACPDVVTPTEADLEEGRAVAEVSMAVGVAGQTTVSAFDVHRDNDNGCKVVTLILYLVCTAEGGGLNIFKLVDDLGHTEERPVATIAARGGRGEPVAVVMRGDVPHCPEPIFGEGERVAVVFQFPVLAA